MASREELLALAARLVIASDILERKPCEAYRLQQDCLAAAEELRRHAQRAPDPDAMNDKRMHEDMTLAHNARKTAIEECARIADGFTCGCCGMDGKAGIAIRALSAVSSTVSHAIEKTEGGAS